MRLPAGLPDTLAGDRTLVMGVLNVTPDSFSDGGRFIDPEVAVRHGLDLVADGADIVDVGGESTRPGASRVPADREWERIGPVIGGLADHGVVVSVDTMRATTAVAAVAAGAALVNDVSGGLADPDMPAALADLGVPCVLMHWRGHSDVMDSLTRYDDVVAEVCGELADRVGGAVAAGVSQDRIILDPGLGFAKTPAQNWQVLQGWHRLTELGHPILIGAARKRFLGELLGDGSGPRPPQERDDATVALSALAAARGAWAVRVHRVRGNADAVRVAAAWPEEER